MSTTAPVIGRPLVRQGHWLTAASLSGVVLEASFAQALHLSLGSTFRIDGLDGSSVPATVVGVADTSSQGFYPDQTPGLMWVRRGLFTKVEPVRKHTEEAVGLRLAAPSLAIPVAQEATARLGPALTGALTWQQVEQSMNGSDPLLGLLLALFGLVALGGALLAISNAAGGRVLTAGTDLAMLKTLGFTSRQLVGTLLVEHAGLAVVGTGAGVVTARLLTALLSRELPVGSLAAIAPLPAGLGAAVRGRDRDHGAAGHRGLWLAGRAGVAAERRGSARSGRPSVPADPGRSDDALAARRWFSASGPRLPACRTPC